MIYRFLKFIFGYAVRSYFRKIELRNAENVPDEGPVIFLPNHRSALMDPIVVAVYLKREVNFLARGESFRNPRVASILKQLNMTPVCRKDKSPEEMHKNEDTFKHCFGLLEQQGALVIFPEGASQSKPLLLKLKTGSARIAFGAEAKNDFKLGVTLVPVGINYTNPHRFQGKMFLNFGNPIKVTDYKKAYLDDPIKAVQTLTAKIEDELKRLIVVVDDSRWHDLTDKVDRIVQSDAVRFGIGKENENIGWFMARKEIAGAIDYFRNEKMDVLEGIEIRVQQYFSIIELLNLTEGALNPLGKKKDGRVKFWALLVYFILGFPLFAIGYVLHIIPYYLTHKVSIYLVKKTDFYGSILLVTGLIFFGINGFGLTWLVYYLTENAVIAVLFFFLLPTVGLFTFQYFVRLRRWSAGFRFQFIGKRKTAMIEKLKEDREALLAIFKSAHNDYIHYQKKIIAT